MSGYIKSNLRMEPVGAGKGSVVDNIIEQVKDAIACGRFKPGDKLPSEFAMMEELEVSRNSLREAMKVLSAMGVLVIRRGNGTYINTEIKANVLDYIQYSMLFESSGVNEIVELRQILEEDVLSLAIKKCSEEDIKTLKSYIDEMRYYFSDGEISKAAKADYQFHMYLTECCRNKFLQRIMEGIYPLFQESIEKNIRTNEQFASADKHHEALLKCLIEKDERKVPQAVAESLSSWRNNVKNQE